MEKFPKLITAAIPGQADRFYLIDRNYNLIPEVKDLVDLQAGTKRSPNTIRGLCVHLRWFYEFLEQRGLNVLEVKPSDLVDYLLWLSDPYRQGVLEPKLFQRSTINQNLRAVGNFYSFLVRQGQLTESPVLYRTVKKDWRASVDGDFLAHTRQQGQSTVQRMDLLLKEPKSLPKTVSPSDLEHFVNQIHSGKAPNIDPVELRNQSIVLVLKESGLRIGELLGTWVSDLDHGSQGIHVKFRPNNTNGARAKAGYGRDRFVHLPPELFGLLDIYLSEVWVNANCHSDYLWLVLKKNAVNKDGQSTFGTPLTASAVSEMFVRYSEQSGVKIHPHMLRHTHATDLVRSYIERGERVDWKFISDRLGHSSVLTTMRNYVHLTKEDYKAAYKKYRQRRTQKNVRRQQ